MPATKDRMGSDSVVFNLESKDLYQNLGIPRGSSDATIRKAYYQLALRYHPDRSPECKVEFQRIGRAYEILGNPGKRQLYDESGIIEGDDWLSTGEANFEAYFRNLFQKVRLEDIEAFRNTYVGSLEEYEDVLSAYRKRHGNVEEILDDIFFGDEESALPRITAILKRAIDKGIVDDLSRFHQIVSDKKALEALQRSRKRRANKEAREAAELAKELGLDGPGDAGNRLASLIKNKQDTFDSMIASFEAKYGADNRDSKKHKKKKTN